MGVKSLKKSKCESTLTYLCMVVPIQLWEHKLCSGMFVKFLYDILYPRMLYCCLNIAVYCQRRCLKELKGTC